MSVSPVAHADAGTARVVLPGMLRDLTDGVGEVNTQVGDDGSDLGSTLDAALAPWPKVANRVRDERGEIRRHVNVFVDGQDAKRGDGLATLVRPGSVVHVVNAISGG